MQKIINVLAIASAVVSVTVVGTAGYVYIRKDAIIESIKEKALGSVMPKMPSLSSPVETDSIPPVGEGFGIPQF